MVKTQFQPDRKRSKKTRKLLLFPALACVLIALVTAAWVLRNQIIERLSGPVLAEFGLEIVAVSLDAFASRDATIGHLELRHSSGTTIEIDELLLAVRNSRDGRRRYQAGRVTVTPGDSANDSGINWASLSRQLLAIPETVPAIDVSIGELFINNLFIDDLPMLNKVAFSTHESQQELTFELAADRMDFVVQRTGDARYEAQLSLATGSGAQQDILASIADRDDGIDIDLRTEADLTVWHEILSRSSLQLPAMTFEPGTALLELSVAIPNDPASAAPNWNLALETAVVRVATGDWPVFLIRAQQISCQSGIKCSMQATATANDMSVASGTAKSMRLDASVEIEEATEAWSVLLAPGTTVSADQLMLADAYIAHVDATVESGASIDYAESGWRLTIGAMNAQIEDLNVADASTSSALRLHTTSLLASADSFLAKTDLTVPGLEVNTPALALSLPEFTGALTLDQETLTARILTAGLHEDGAIELSLDTKSGSGSIALHRVVNSFATRRLSDVVTSPLPEFDLTAGTASLGGNLTVRRWSPVEGSLSTQLSDVAGFVSSIAFTGVATDLRWEYDTSTGLQAQPADISIDLVDIGVPLRGLTASYQLHIQGKSADISELQMAAFGGVVKAEPFSVAAHGVGENVLVTLHALDLAELLAMQDFAAVELAGKVDGTLPVTVVGDSIRIEGGRIDGIAPGGVIRYRQAGAGNAQAASGMDIATKALSNFEYETLSSDVSYQENGDLVLQMQIRGRNPDLEGGRPIVLNLGVENNIPQMLRSLQATRSIQDILERRVTQ